MWCDVLEKSKGETAESSIQQERSDEGLTLETSANTLLRRSAYPHQLCVDTLYVLKLRRRRPKRVLTGTSIPLYNKNGFDNIWHGTRSTLGTDVRLNDVNNHYHEVVYRYEPIPV